MSYPAYESFGKQIGRGYAAWRVYMALQPPMLDFAEARDVKVDAIAETLTMGRRQVRQALSWLALNGYVIEHQRGARRVRSLRLAYALKKEAA